MKFTSIVLVICSLFLLPSLHAQAKKFLPCANPPIDREAEDKVQAYIQAGGRAALPSRLLRVYFHILRDSDGSNPAATAANIETEFADLVNDYTDGDICFANMGYNFIDNTEMNNNFDIDEDESLLFLFLVADCLNIFYHSKLFKGESDAFGAAYSIPNTYCSIAKVNIGAKSISHEVGHCLGLSHTHETVDGDEYIDGTDCGVRGDKVCDTPADPLRDSIEYPCFSATINCLYTGTCVDPGGETDYSPPYNNIMSYWLGFSCPRNQLTDGQYLRVHFYLSVTPDLGALQSVSTLTYGPVVKSSGFEMESAIDELETNGIVLLIDDVEACLQANTVNLKPGFTALPDNGSITVRATICD